MVLAGREFARHFRAAVPDTPRNLPAAVEGALRLIEEGALDEGSVGDLAASLGIGERHLRRLFKRYVGRSPVHVAQSRRLREAKRLVCESNRSMAHIALAAGYNSVRRFNAAFLTCYGCSPRELRRRQGGEPRYALVFPSIWRTPPPTSQT